MVPTFCGTGIKPHLLVNPGSGKYSPESVQTAVNELEYYGMRPEVSAVRNPADTAVRIREIYASNDRPFIVVGAGDGTFNAVLNCVPPGTATLAVLPMGTSNVMAAEIGVTGIPDGIARIVAGNTRPLTAGIIESNGIRRRFSLMAGAGVDGAVVRDVGPKSKRLLKQGAYLVSFLRRCLAWDSETFPVSIAGRTLDCHTVIVCKSSRYAGDFVLAPVSSPFSEGLTAVCITMGSRISYLKAALALISGRPLSNPTILKLVADSVEISGNRPIQADGDFMGYCPARITTESGIAEIIV